MFTGGALAIELHRGSTISLLDVQCDRAVIGSGAHCDVRLAPDEAAVEQLVIELIGDDEVYARTRALEPVCLLNGAPFLEGRLAENSVLELGAIALRVRRTALQETSAKAKRSSASTSPAMQAIGVLGVIIGLFVVLSKPSSSETGWLSPVDRPPLAALEPELCPQREPLAAGALGQQLRVLAEIKRERAPFHPGDALAGAPLFERAASCYAAAGDPELARDMHAAAAKLHDQVGSEIQLRHVQLERSLFERQFAEARRQATLLSQLIPKTGEYAAWLSLVQREGELRREEAR